MTRLWFAVECVRFREPRFRKLSHPAQLAVLYLEGLAGDRSPEAIWRDDAEVLEYLIMAGWKAADLPAIIHELHVTDWIDTLPDGRVGLPEWDAVQQYMTKKIRDKYEAARQRAWRAEKKERQQQQEEVRLLGSGDTSRMEHFATLLPELPQ